MKKGETMSLREQIFTIPNILVYIRILLIPVFVGIYLNAKSQSDYYWAFGVMVFAFFTDLIDGKIARHFNCVTDLGKTIDPIGDKLYQFAVAFCLVVKYPLIKLLIVIMAIKEITLGIMGIVLIKRGGKVFGAKWFGKLCTAYIDVMMAVFMIAPVVGIKIHPGISSFVILFAIVMIVANGIKYAFIFTKKIKEQK